MDEPEPEDWDTIEHKISWDKFKYDSYCLYSTIAKQGNRFWLDQKVDKRGRMYAEGYHITTQGKPFKKAMIELANEEIIEGVTPCYVLTVGNDPSPPALSAQAAAMLAGPSRTN